jgi:hypothetical protein
MIAAALLGLAAWLIFSAKKAKKRPRYTTDDQRRSFWEADKMLEHIKEKPKVETIPLKLKKKPRPKKKKRKTKAPTAKTKEQSKEFNLEDAIVASQIIQRKNRNPKNER